jgi:hypothetical protein
MRCVLTRPERFVSLSFFGSINKSDGLTFDDHYRPRYNLVMFVTGACVAESVTIQHVLQCDSQ